MTADLTPIPTKPTWTPGAKNEERAATLTAARDANGKPIAEYRARRTDGTATIRSIKPIPADWYERILKRREV